MVAGHDPAGEGDGQLPNKPLQSDEAATFNSEPVYIVGLRASW